jgi:hypothetical protein
MALAPHRHGLAFDRAIGINMMEKAMARSKAMP